MHHDLWNVVFDLFTPNALEVIISTVLLTYLLTYLLHCYNLENLVLLYQLIIP